MIINHCNIISENVDFLRDFDKTYGTVETAQTVYLKYYGPEVTIKPGEFKVITYPVEITMYQKNLDAGDGGWIEYEIKNTDIFNDNDKFSLMTLPYSSSETKNKQIRRKILNMGKKPFKISSKTPPLTRISILGNPMMQINVFIKMADTFKGKPLIFNYNEVVNYSIENESLTTQKFMKELHKNPGPIKKFFRERTVKEFVEAGNTVFLAENIFDKICEFDFSFAIQISKIQQFLERIQKILSENEISADEIDYAVVQSLKEVINGQEYSDDSVIIEKSDDLGDKKKED